jgi:uncharacterized membrane protein
MDEEFVAVIFPDEDKAYEAARALRAAHADPNTEITVYGLVVVKREADGTLAIKRRDEYAARTLGLGALIGALIGLLGGPAGVLVGLAAGSGVGTLRLSIHADVTDEFAEDIVRELQPGNWAVVAAALEDWRAPIDALMEPLGGRVVRESQKGFVEHLIEKQVDAGRAELNKRKLEHQTAKAEKTESQLDTQVRDTAAKLQRTADKAMQRLDEAKQELSAKIQALEEQAASATPEVRDRIEQRMVAMKEDFRKREQKLNHAYELAKEALQP